MDVVGALAGPRRSSRASAAKNSDGGVGTASTSVLKLVRTIQKIGKKISPAASQPTTVRIELLADLADAWPGPQSAMFLAMERTRKTATMLARMTAITPPAEAPPTSYSRRARR